MTDTTKQVVTVDTEYDQFVDRLAKERDGRTISNSSDMHALSILRGVFSHAKKYVKLFSGSLSLNVYNDEKLIDAMKHFVSNEGKVEILIQHPDKLEPSNKFLKELFDLKKTGQVKIFEVTENNALKNAQIHFLVSDDSVYRIEVDIDNIKAIGSFNDEPRAAELKAAFDSGCSKDVNEYQGVGLPATA